MEEIPCTHHWVIDEAKAPTSHGACQRCGMEKEFENWVTQDNWNPENRVRPALEPDLIIDADV